MDEAPRHAEPCHAPDPSAERAELVDLVLRRATSHHRTTRVLSGEPDIADFAIGFHAHQTIQHSLVAVLVHAGAPPPHTHALERIVGLLAERGVTVPPPLMTSGWLDPWAVQARYEDVEPALDQRRALETATLAIDWASRLVSPADARDPDQAARSDMLPLPPGWDRTVDGQPMPDIVAAVRDARAGR
jgi:HEPN domain-containing protein